MKNNIFDLTGQVALVAGGSSGLGLQFAKAMANAGANVAIVARRTDRLEKNAKEIAAEYGVEVYPHYLDLCDSKSVTKRGGRHCALRQDRHSGQLRRHRRFRRPGDHDR